MSIVKSSRLVKISSWILVILWIALIFTLSVQTAEQSAGLSSQVTKIIVKTVSWFVPIDTDVRAIDKMVTQIHNLVRKFAHGGLYFVLGILVINSFIQAGTKYRKILVLVLLRLFYFGSIVGIVNCHLP